MNPYKRFVARNSPGRIFRFGPCVDLVDNNDLGTVVDLADLPALLDRTWAVVKSNGQFRARAAAKRGEPGTAVFLARFLLAPPAGAEVDHINREPLDNRRCNLRIAGRHLNCLNRRWRNARRSGLPQGVHPIGGRRLRYLARMSAGGRPWVSKLVDTIPQAEHMYRRMRQEYEAYLVAGGVPQDFIPSESACTGGQPRQRRVKSRIPGTDPNGMKIRRNILLHRLLRRVPQHCESASLPRTVLSGSVFPQGHANGRASRVASQETMLTVTICNSILYALSSCHSYLSPELRFGRKQRGAEIFLVDNHPNKVYNQY